MKPFGVVGSTDADVRAVTEQLVERLSSEGSVAVVTRLDDPVDDSSRPSDADVVFGLDDAGSWRATGTDTSLSTVLDDLAPEHAYVIVEGFPDTALPYVAVGAVDHGTDPILELDSPDSVESEAVIEALETVDSHETLSSLIERAKRSPDAEKAGAIATFTGRVRAKDHDDDPPTTHLEFEKYEGIAKERMETISTKLESRDGVYTVLLYHRTGVIEDGEDIVFVVVLAGHRTEAFETVRDGINRLKAEVPIFKKEVTIDETFWVHERS